MNERLKEFLTKVHDPKNNIPMYVTITIRPGQKVVDFKIKKEASNILKVIVHDEKNPGWFLHSYHIPIKNLGMPVESKNKELLEILNEPRRITGDKATKALLEDIQRKYIEVLSESKKHYFKTQRFKKKKEMRMGTQMKGF